MGMKRDLDERVRAQLERKARQSGTQLAVDRVDGHWRAGFLSTDPLGETVFVVYATGADEEAALRRLAHVSADDA